MNEGESVTFGYTTSTPQSWTVPEDAYYNIYAYGAAGGYGAYYGNVNNDGYNNNPGNGHLRASRILLDAGTVLSIVCGGKPNSGVSNGWGEGSANGNDRSNSEDSYVGGYATHMSSTWNRSGTTYGVGHFDKYRGYPNGSYGGDEHTICDSDGNHSGGACGGGGGGSSYVILGGVTIIQGGGASGGASHYHSTDGEGTASAGSGGGATTLTNPSGADSDHQWQTSKLNVTTAGANSGSGKIVITMDELASRNIYYNNNECKNVYIKGTMPNGTVLSEYTRMGYLYYNNNQIKYR